MSVKSIPEYLSLTNYQLIFSTSRNITTIQPCELILLDREIFLAFVFEPGEIVPIGQLLFNNGDMRTKGRFDDELIDFKISSRARSVALSALFGRDLPELLSPTYSTLLQRRFYWSQRLVKRWTMADDILRKEKYSCVLISTPISQKAILFKIEHLQFPNIPNLLYRKHRSQLLFCANNMPLRNWLHCWLKLICSYCHVSNHGEYLFITWAFCQQGTLLKPGQIPTI